MAKRHRKLLGGAFALRDRRDFEMMFEAVSGRDDGVEERVLSTERRTSLNILSTQDSALHVSAGSASSSMFQ